MKSTIKQYEQKMEEEDAFDDTEVRGAVGHGRSLV